MKPIEDAVVTSHQNEERQDLHHPGDDAKELHHQGDGRVDRPIGLPTDLWPCPWLVEYAASESHARNRDLARRLLDHPAMGEAWTWARSRYSEDQDKNLMLIIRAYWVRTTHYYTQGEKTLRLTTAKDEARPFQAIAKTARELHIQLRLHGIWLDGEDHDPNHPEANPTRVLGDMLKELAKDADTLARHFARTHPNPRNSTSPDPRPGIPPARHPRRKTLNRLLARAFWRGEPYTAVERRLIGIITEAALGPDLEAPPPVTSRMVKEDLRGIDLDDDYPLHRRWYRRLYPVEKPILRGILKGLESEGGS